MALPVFFIAITFAFFVLRLAPGGPFDGERPLPPEIKANLERHYNLDKPLVAQYGIYMKNVIWHQDLGPSFIDKAHSVNEKIAKGLPFSLVLGGMALLTALSIGTLSGVIGAFRQNTKIDYIIAFVVLFGVVMPNFIMAPLLQEYMAKPLNGFASKIAGENISVLAMSGWGNPVKWNNITFTHLFLPVIVLALPHIARISRLMRASTIEVLGTNYIRTARAKGIGERLTIMRHALKPAFIPVLSYMGPATSYILTGSLVVESIFGLPGVGSFFIEASLSRDYGVVLGMIILYVLLVTSLNLIVDILYAFLDPKVRLK